MSQRNFFNRKQELPVKLSIICQFYAMNGRAFQHQYEAVSETELIDAINLADTQRVFYIVKMQTPLKGTTIKITGKIGDSEVDMKCNGIENALQFAKGLTFKEPCYENFALTLRLI